MCEDCGCSEMENQVVESEDSLTIHTHTPILSENNALAHKNQHWFDDNDIITINLMSSPGAGKTLLLEKTVEYFGNEINLSILTGDLQTTNDADRLKKVGANAKQITTHSACHLDAKMIADELGGFITPTVDLCIIENVGNLVCPSAFPLGESLRVAMLSITEGEDKPVKYPVMFNKADVIVLTKMDLLPHLKFDMNQCLKYIKQVNPSAKIIELSAFEGTGMNEWFELIRENVPSRTS
jgi:hydrogenase nickel incorporation protein HypB